MNSSIDPHHHLNINGQYNNPSMLLSHQNIDDIEEDYKDLYKLIMTPLYYSKNGQTINQNLISSQSIASESVNKIVKQVLQGIEDIEMSKKVPFKSANHTLYMCEHMVLPAIGIQDESSNDYLTNGLIEDKEPMTPGQDAWIRSRIIVEHKTQEQYDNIGLLPDFGKNPKKAFDNRSMISVKSKQSNRSNKSKGKDKNTYNPLPINLAEPNFTSKEEEKLRKQKEEERKIQEIKQNLQFLKTQEDINNEQQRLEKMKKEKNVIGTTYDYSGEIIPVQKVKLNRFPPSTYQMNFQYKDEEIFVDPKAKKKLRKQGLPSIKKKQNPLQNIHQTKQADSQPIILDTIPLSQGVTLTYEGKKRIGPRPQTYDSQTLLMASLHPGSVKSLKPGQRIRLSKHDYDSIISNQEQLGSHKVNKEDERQVQTQQLPRTENIFGKTLDSVMFATKLKQSTFSKQQNTQSQGSIQIKSVRMYETLNNQINEEDEIMLSMMQQKEKEEQSKILKQKREKANRKTPIDEFNQMIANNKNWGKEAVPPQQGQTLLNYPFGLRKPGQKEQVTSLGQVQKPRSRMGPPRTPETFDVRVSTAEGFGRPGTTQDGFRPGTRGATGLQSQQGLRIKVTRNPQQLQQEYM